MAENSPGSHAALILIVDDDEAVVEVAAESLETLGYDVLTTLRLSNYYVAAPLISVLFTDNRCSEWEVRSLPRLR
jgi:CheY-like chemotaxis protein